MEGRGIGIPAATNSMTLFHRFIAFLFVIANALGVVAHAEQPAGDVRAEMDKVRSLAQESLVAALDRVQAARRALGPDASYEARQHLLRTEIWVRDDLGQMDEVYAMERESRQLAEARGDAAGAARARLAEVRKLLQARRLDDAQALLDEILARAPQDRQALFTMAVERLQGDIFSKRGRFAESLAAYQRGLRALRGLHAQPGDPANSGLRALLYSRIAKMYIGAENLAKAIDNAELGLAERKISLGPLSSLQFTRAIALMQSGREREGIAALEDTLATAVRGGMRGTEAAVRGNIADYYLRQHDYVRAQAESRKALAVSEQGGNRDMILMARANLGFALMGQGRIKEGLPWVDGVIADLRKEKAIVDVAEMLDEKGRMLERAGQFQQALAIVRERQSLLQQTARAARDRAVSALQEEFDAHRRSQQIALLRRESRLKDVELSNRRTVQLATTFGAVLTVLAGAVVTVLYRRAARSNARLKELNTQLEFGSTHDPLTGLHNRRALTRRMSLREDDRRHPVPDAVDCFVLMDVDHFKSINDRWGHGAGDAVLVDVARRLAAAVRDTDMVVRWGGEEFMIHAPAMDPASVAGMAERILDAIGGKPVDVGTCAIPVTLTAGILALPGAGTAFDWQCAVRLADWALYQGKALGRNQARIVTRLYAPADTVMAALDREDGDVAPLLALDCVRGPGQPAGRSVPAPALVPA